MINSMDEGDVYDLRLHCGELSTDSIKITKRRTTFMKKSVVAILMVLALVVCVFPVSAFAANNSTVNPYAVGKRNSTGENWVVTIDGTDYWVSIYNVIGKGNSKYIREVDVAQQALNRIDARFYHAHCNAGLPDGKFGDNTFNAVIGFQDFYNTYKAPSASYKIDVDGAIGPNTWSRITLCSN